MNRQKFSLLMALLMVITFTLGEVGAAAAAAVSSGKGESSTNDLFPFSAESVTKATYGKVVHITLDGFYSELFDLAKEKGTSIPNLSKLVSSGVRFTDMKTTIPSNQAARYSAMTGAYPTETVNTSVYYDPAAKAIVGDGQNRPEYELFTNQAETLTQVLTDNGRSALAINMKAVKDEPVYMATGSTTMQAAVEAAIQYISANDQPDYLALYSDDLRIGGTYLNNQSGLADNMLLKLQAVDVQLGLLMDKIKEIGNSQATTYVITSNVGNAAGAAKQAPAVVNALSGLGFPVAQVRAGALSDCCVSGDSMPDDPSILWLKNYQAKYMQLYFLKEVSEVEYNQIVSKLKSLAVVQDVLGRAELQTLRVDPRFADLLVVPATGATFNPAATGQTTIDTLEPELRTMFAIISGNKVALEDRGGKVKEEVAIVDWAPTIASLLAVRNPRNSEGRNLLNMGVSLVDSGYAIYINWDGFAYNWYELANTASYTGTPTLNALIQEGITFTNARTNLPSITNPMQVGIVTGGYPIDTGNSYRYYDVLQNKVIQYARDNKLETLAEAAVNHGIDIAAAATYIFEGRGAEAGNEKRPYFGDIGFGEAVDVLINLINEQPVVSGGKTIKMDGIPRFMSAYGSQIDADGHNQSGNTVATLKEYNDRIAKTVIDYDAHLGRLVQALKDAGIYERTTIFLTTDHGMATFGAPMQNPQPPYPPGTLSSLTDLEQTIAEVGQMFQGENFKVESVYQEGQQAQPDTQVVITSVGLNAMINFRIPVENAVYEEIVKRVQSKEYYGDHLYKMDLLKRGMPPGWADLLISPKPPYNFKTGNPDQARGINGQHDSLDDSASHIFMLMSGAAVKKQFVYDKQVLNLNVGPTIARVLGIEGPSGAKAQVLDDVLIYAYRGPLLKIDDLVEDAVTVNTEYVTLKGSTSPQAMIRINGELLGSADDAGIFAVQKKLDLGINRLIVEAEADGRKTRQIVFATYEAPREELRQKLELADSLYKHAVEGSEFGQYKPGSRAALFAVIRRAMQVNDNPAALEVEVTLATLQLSDAIAQFRAGFYGGYHIYGDFLLNGADKQDIRITLHNDDNSVSYTAAYKESGTTSLGKYQLSDATDALGNVMAGRLHYYFDVPAGAYTITVTLGDNTVSTQVETNSNTLAAFPWGTYFTQYVEDMSMQPTNLEGPAVPMGLTAHRGNGKVSLSWEANKEPNLAGYYIYVNGEQTASYTTGNTSFTIDGLKNGQMYSFRISAFDTSGKESEKSAEVAVIPGDMSFIISDGVLTRTAGISATVKVTPSSNSAQEGMPTVVFELMKGTTPVSIIALQQQLTSPEVLTAHFNVSGADYTVKVFVVDRFDGSLENIGNSLAEPVTLR
ncbi:alkaline phosphatase family protein [Paenibacillus marinisediminis]